MRPIIAGYDTSLIRITDIQFKLGKPGSVLGCDFSGVVVKAGRNVTNGIQVGDHVAGVAHGCTYPDKGAYAEYVKADSELVWVVPKNTFGEEQAAAYGVAYVHVLFALGRVPDRSMQASGHQCRPCITPSTSGWWSLRRRSPSPNGCSSTVAAVSSVINCACAPGAITNNSVAACGLSAIQLARLSGYNIVTTASSRNHELLKSLGAHVTIDYREADLVSKIKQATGDSIKYALETIGDEETKRVTVQAIAPSGGKVVGLNPLQSEESERKEVTFHSASLIIIFSCVPRLNIRN